MFKITDGKGFHVTFENGYTVSVQWGGNNYCDNRHCDLSNEFLGKEGCANADVAAWPENGERNYVKLTGDDNCESNIGWQSPAEVLAILNRIAALPPIQERVVFPVPQPNTALIVIPKAAQYGNLF